MDRKIIKPKQPIMRLSTTVPESLALKVHLIRLRRRIRTSQIVQEAIEDYVEKHKLLLDI